MSKEEIKKPVNTRLPQAVIDLWHAFAVETRRNKEQALAEIIIRGTDYNPRRKTLKRK
jgi:hypothetical protein